MKSSVALLMLEQGTRTTRNNFLYLPSNGRCLSQKVILIHLTIDGVRVVLDAGQRHETSKEQVGMATFIHEVLLGVKGLDMQSVRY